MRRSVRLTCFRINTAVDVTAVALKIISALHVAYCSPVRRELSQDEHVKDAKVEQATLNSLAFMFPNN